MSKSKKSTTEPEAVEEVVEAVVAEAPAAAEEPTPTPAVEAPPAPVAKVEPVDSKPKKKKTVFL